MKFYQLKAGNIVSIVGSGQRPEGPHTLFLYPIYLPSVCLLPSYFFCTLKVVPFLLIQSRLFLTGFMVLHWVLNTYIVFSMPSWMVFFFKFQLPQAFFHRFSLNSRQTKLKKFSKLKDFSPKIRIFLLNSREIPNFPHENERIFC